jgi:hypothetical protein
MLDAATMVDPALDRDDKAQGHELDHWQSLRGEAVSLHRRNVASSLTPPEKHGQRRDRDDRDLCDIIRSRDAHDWIENQRQDHERLEQE